MKRLCFFALLVGPAPALAQQRIGASAPGAVETSRMLWEQVTGYLVRAAEQMPEAKYAFKPTPDVRSFGQLIAHIAGSQNLFCGTVLGEKGESEDDIEKTTTAKADLVAALKSSNDHCRKAYSISDAAAWEKVELFGQSNSSLYALIMNATHDNEHYGNIVTYMRLQGMVPPSSQPSPR
jgi:uncharacterized damage-inducible protein DinB